MLQETQTILGILIALLTLGSGVLAIWRYLRDHYRKMNDLAEKVLSLESQLTAREAIVLSDSTQKFDRTRVFKKLEAVALEARNAIGAPIVSVSQPIPLFDPQKFQMIYSSESVVASIAGKEFAIKGIPAYVYKTRHGAFNNDVSKDADHPTEITRAAQTNAGEQAILTIPLISAHHFRGIAQFLRPKDRPFVENDIKIAMQWAPELTKLVVELQENPEQDIPVKARGNSALSSILFTDIEDFSNVAEKVSLEVSVDMLNEYYSRLLSVVIANNGHLQEYTGDGMFVSFTNYSPAASARSALTSAIAIQNEFQEILKSWRGYGINVSENKKHMVGIASGELYSGLVGHPKERRDKLVGPAVNLAAHLCEAARNFGSGILICENTAGLVDADNFVIEPAVGVGFLGQKIYQVSHK